MTDTNENTLNTVPPDQDPARFLGASTKDGEVVDEGKKQTTAVAKDTNGKTPAKVAAKPAAKAKEGAEESEDSDESDAANSKPNRSAQKRIDQAIGRQRAAERRADMAEANMGQLERRLAALETRPATVVDNTGKGATSVDANAPQPAAYEYGELDARYIRDLAKYEARKEIAEENTKRNTEQQQSTQTAAARERAAKIDTWAVQGSEKHDDFDEVVIQGAKDGLWPLSETLGQLLMESEVGHEIAYSLASDPKEARRIAKLTAARQAAWFGTEEARLTGDAASSGETDETHKPAVTQAPKPPQHKAKGSGESKPVSSDTNDFAAFEKLAQKQQ
ncbi:MAG: hypothetical protein ACREMY_28120 [bacterium]